MKQLATYRCVAGAAGGLVLFGEDPAMQTANPSSRSVPCSVSDSPLFLQWCEEVRMMVANRFLLDSLAVYKV